MSDSLWPHGLSPLRLLWPQDFPGKNTGVGCHFLLQGIFLTQGPEISISSFFCYRKKELFCGQVLPKHFSSFSSLPLILFSLPRLMWWTRVVKNTIWHFRGGGWCPALDFLTVASVFWIQGASFFSTWGCPENRTRWWHIIISTVRCFQKFREACLCARSL